MHRCALCPVSRPLSRLRHCRPQNKITLQCLSVQHRAATRSTVLAAMAPPRKEVLRFEISSTAKPVTRQVTARQTHRTRPPPPRSPFTAARSLTQTTNRTPVVHTVTRQPSGDFTILLLQPSSKDTRSHAEGHTKCLALDRGCAARYPTLPRPPLLCVIVSVCRARAALQLAVDTKGARIEVERSTVPHLLATLDDFFRLYSTCLRRVYVPVTALADSKAPVTDIRMQFTVLHLLNGGRLVFRVSLDRALMHYKKASDVATWDGHCNGLQLDYFAAETRGVAVMHRRAGAQWHQPDPVLWGGGDESLSPSPLNSKVLRRPAVAPRGSAMCLPLPNSRVFDLLLRLHPPPAGGPCVSLLRRMVFWATGEPIFFCVLCRLRRVPQCHGTDFVWGTRATMVDAPAGGRGRAQECRWLYVYGHVRRVYVYAYTYAHIRRRVYKHHVYIGSLCIRVYVAHTKAMPI